MRNTLRTIWIVTIITVGIVNTSNADIWTIIDMPGAAETIPSGIDGNNVVGGYVISGMVTHGFLFDGRNWITIDCPWATDTGADGVCGNNIVGGYHDYSYPYSYWHGFLYNGGNWITLDPPVGVNTIAEGIDGNNIVGVYEISGTNAFLYNGTTWSTIDPPGAKWAIAYDIDDGNIVGEYHDAGGIYHGFLYNVSNQVWTILDKPGASGTHPYGIDGKNIVGSFRDSSLNGSQSFIYDGTTWRAIMAPGAYDTVARGIDGRKVVGYFDNHGFIYTIPESEPPMANINGPYTIYPNDILTLDASFSKNGNDIFTYLWDLDNDYNFETNAGNLPVFDVNCNYLKSLGLLPGNTYNIHLKVIDNGGQYDINETTLTILSIPNFLVSIDIKPGTCPNPFDINSNDVLTVAVLGTSQFNVTSIDPNSIRLAGVKPLQINYQDAASPVSDSNNCNCTTGGPDGYLDIMLEFDSKKVAEAIGYVNQGDELPVNLTGFLFNSNGFEIPIEGSDCIQIIGEPGKYSGGSGTANDPFRIGTVADWNELMNTSSDWDAYFIMIADINLQVVPLIPVGNDINGVFKGVFDGNGHVIRNAAITNRPGWHIGLFGLIDYNSQILNLGVEDANMAGERDVAGLVGLSQGTITNCYATGKIGIWYGANCAGLVGLNRGIISRCHADCDVNGYYSGGLVGRNDGGTIIDSYAAGTVSGPTPGNYVGGLVGWNIGYYDNHTGIIHSATITRCYATGSVSGDEYVGGLVGENGDDISYVLLSSITDCYATGAVTGTGYVGGLIGSNQSGKRGPSSYYYSVTNCYATGKVTGSGGGLTGPSVCPTLNCFWDIETSGKATSGSGTGLTSAQMKTLSTFTSAGWDFSYTDGNQAVWFMPIDEYPILTWQISPADLYTDGKNNFRDFAIFAEYWQRKDCAIYNDYCEWADMNFDGHVDINDLVDFISYWLEEGIY